MTLIKQFKSGIIMFKPQKELSAVKILVKRNKNPTSKSTA